MRTSVALATYNGEKYITEQLESILNQTVPADEVIITDDCSTDRTAEIVEDFIKKHSLSGTWRFSVNEANRGFAENFRLAINAATGDLIFPCDQDDVWVEDRIERMTAEMKKNPEIGVLNTRQNMFCDGEEPWKGRPLSPDAGTPKRIELTSYTRFLRSLGCEMVIRESFYESVKEHWYKGWAHDEFLWSLGMLYGACYEWEYVSLYRRIHENQVSSRFGHEKQKRIDYLQGVKQSSEHLLRLCEDKGMPDDVCKLFRNNVETHRLRLELIRDRKLLHAFRLLPRLRYYYAPKSYLVELSMALKG